MSFTALKKIRFTSQEIYISSLDTNIYSSPSLIRVDLKKFFRSFIGKIYDKYL
jgi:hypothetical protein